jgi:hypothetical protein
MQFDKFAGSEFERRGAVQAMKVGRFSPQAKEAPPECRCA